MTPLCAFADESDDYLSVHVGKSLIETYYFRTSRIFDEVPISSDPNIAEVQFYGTSITMTGSGMYYGVELKFTGISEGIATISFGSNNIYVAVTKHTPGESKIVREPNCIENGEKIVTCSECGETYSKETISSLGDVGHVPGKPVEENIVEATYEETGSCDSVVYCSICGKELERNKRIIQVKVRSTSISSLKSTKSHQAIVKWKTKENVDGYQIYLSKSSKFKSDLTTKSLVKSSNISSKKYTKLSSGKTYYFKVRSYRVLDDKKVYSKWSSVKKVKVK